MAYVGALVILILFLWLLRPGKKITCGNCNGKGKVLTAWNDTRICTFCGGSGKVST